MEEGKMKQVILASQSPRRKELLMQIGIVPAIDPSNVMEKVTSTDPAEVVLELSLQKAENVAARYTEDDVMVIGADTVVSIDGRILGKPKTHAEAFEMISALEGRTHQVYTGVAVIFPNEVQPVIRFSVCTDVQVYPMTEYEIRKYADTDEPMDKAGAYGIQGTFAKYIRGIDGDYNTVVGLPIAELYQKIKGWL